MKQKIQTTIEIITPKKAKQILELNTHNRRPSPAHIAALATDMINGDWKTNGDAIRFNSSYLLDGQHRLHAVIKSDVPIETLVVRGLSEDVFHTIDTNLKQRTLLDVLNMEAIKGSQVLASMSKWVERYFIGELHEALKFTVSESLALIDKYPGMIESACYITPKRKRLVLAPGVLGACHYIFKQIDEDLAGTFVEGVDTGVGLESGNPIRILREKFIKYKMSKASIRPRDQMVLCISAWNYLRENAYIKSLYMPTSYTGKVAK